MTQDMPAGVESTAPILSVERLRITYRGRHAALRAVDDFGYYDAARKAFAVDPGDYEVAVGGSSADLPVRTTLRIQ